MENRDFCLLHALRQIHLWINWCNVHFTHSIDECYRFFEDLCTVQEIKAMSQRLVVAHMLSEKMQVSTVGELNEIIVNGGFQELMPVIVNPAYTQYNHNKNNRNQKWIKQRQL